MTSDCMPGGRRQCSGNGARKHNAYGKSANGKFHFSNPLSIKFDRIFDFLRC